MNGRIVGGLVGLGILGFGLMGLFYPVQTLSFAGFSPASESMRAQAYGETRAIYGGTFTLIGVWTIFAASNPIIHRRLMLMVALIFYGILTGRMLGVSIDGNPGLFGWIGASLELLTGSLLLAATYLHRQDPPVPTD